MTERFQIFKCNVCGNIIEIQHGEGVNPVCCDQPMNLIEAKTADAGKEKHVPVIEKIPGGFKVTVGSVLHPMEANHYIEWIQLMADNRAYRQYLKPGEQPVAVFMIDAAKVSAREYCNVHGLWKADK